MRFLVGLVLVLAMGVAAKNVWRVRGGPRWRTAAEEREDLAGVGVLLLPPAVNGVWWAEESAGYAVTLLASGLESLGTPVQLLVMFPGLISVPLEPQASSPAARLLPLAETSAVLAGSWSNFPGNQSTFPALLPAPVVLSTLAEPVELAPDLSTALAIPPPPVVTMFTTVVETIMVYVAVESTPVTLSHITTPPSAALSAPTARDTAMAAPTVWDLWVLATRDADESAPEESSRQSNELLAFEDSLPTAIAQLLLTVSTATNYSPPTTTLRRRPLRNNGLPRSTPTIRWFRNVPNFNPQQRSSGSSSTGSIPSLFLVLAAAAMLV